jgi:hypothetical protein
MRADGTVIKFRSPVSVKEILVDYPDHRIYEAAAGPPLGIGSFTLPLPERAGLVAGHLYYLVPLPLPKDKVINYNNIPRPSSDHSIPSASGSRLQPESCADIGRNSIKQGGADDHVVNKINKGGVRIISSSKSTDGSTVRVKLRLRKEDLDSFLSALIQGATRQSPWKPSLDAIAEPDSPDGDL